jgi:hypothetical protein
MGHSVPARRRHRQPVDGQDVTPSPADTAAVTANATDHVSHPAADSAIHPTAGVRPMQHPADRVPGGLGRLLAIATLPPTTRVGERHFPAFGRATGEADPARNGLRQVTL